MSDPWAETANHIARWLGATEHTYSYDKETHTLQMTVRLQPAPEYVEVVFQKPPPSRTCPICEREYGWSLDPDGEWELDAEWWGNGEFPFLCSVHCWRKAEGYVWNRDTEQWDRPDVP